MPTWAQWSGDHTRCGTDAAIVGGEAYECDGVMLRMDIDYGTREASDVWMAPVCLAHLTPCVLFLMSENDWDQYADSWRITFHPYTLADARATEAAFHATFRDALAR